MRTLAETDTSGVLLKLLNDAKLEADELRSRLERAERILLSTRLIMGHEIKRPATAIVGYLDLALEKADEETQGGIVDAIRKARRECQPLDELGAFFLRLLKADPVRSRGRETTMDAEQCVSEALDRLPDGLRARERVTVRIAPGAEALRADTDVVNVILVNLVENALRYSGSDSPVDVSVEKSADRRGADAGNLIKIRVADRGVGIPEDSIRAVFKPFVRLQEGESRGAGLGLTLVRSLAELQGGSVFIRSEENKGTTVYVTIPEAPNTDRGAVLP
jgi:signal transduction histidine kinase